MSSEFKIPNLSIGNLSLPIPVIQGGMGVDVSSFRLASAVSNEGALGVIAAVGASQHCTEPHLRYEEKSYRGLRRIIQETKKRTTQPFGVNIMCALSDYEKLVQAAVDENVAAIISGAGLPLHLPSLVGASPVKLIPIVSSARAASIICRTWYRRYQRLPDAIIVEGSEAGGHLGFSTDELAHPTPLGKIITEVLQYTDTLTEKYQCRIPVIAAGGIFTGADIAYYLNLGAAGVQMATRFVCTDECDADPKFKEAYLNCRQEDILIVKSPVGMPLRVLRNPLIDELLQSGKKPFTCTYHCLKSCNPANSPYCIAKALSKAAKGDLAEGIITCGINTYRVNEIVPVQTLLAELMLECRRNLTD